MPGIQAVIGDFVWCARNDLAEELQRIERDIDFVLYRGYHQPPSEEEYRRIVWSR